MNIKKLLKESILVAIVYACFCTALLELFVIISGTSWDEFVRANYKLVFGYCFVIIAVMKPATKKLKIIMFGDK